MQVNIFNGLLHGHIAYNTTIQDKIPNHMSNLTTNKLVVKWVFTQQSKGACL